MAHATPDDLAARCDERTLAELVSDTGQPVGVLTTNPILLVALSEASGRINAALGVASMYSAADLAALTGDDAELLKGLTCRIALVQLFGRRPSPRMSEWAAEMRKETEEFLELLRSGKNLFNVPAVADAGLPSVDGLTTVDYHRLNLLTQRARGYYPSSPRLPVGR